MQNINYTMKYIIKWLLLAVLLGAVGASLAYLLQYVIQLFTYYRQGISPIITLGAVGVLLYFLYMWDPRARGHGTNHYLISVNEDHHASKIKHATSKFIATILTIGAGGSGGLTGPTLQIGSGVSSILERFFQKDEIRLLLLSGAAAMLGAILHSPIGAGLFVVEITYRTSLHYKDIFPAILASTFGYLISNYLFHMTPILNLSGAANTADAIPFVILASILGGLVAVLYIFLFQSVQEFYMTSKFKPVVFFFSFILVGLFVYMVPNAGGLGTSIFGYLFTTASLKVLLTLLFAKLVTTTITVGVGGSGGLVLPALILGAITGAILGSAIGLPAYYLPALIVAGMAASLSGTANAPIAVSVLLIEIAGIEFAYAAVLGSIIGYALSNTETIYDTNNDPLDTV